MLEADSLLVVCVGCSFSISANFLSVPWFPDLDIEGETSPTGNAFTLLASKTV